MKSLFSFLSKIINLFIGKFNWTPPGWLKAIGDVKKGRPVVFWLTIGALVAGGIGYQYTLSQPKQPTIKAEIKSPGITPRYENARPDNLLVIFKYDFSKLNSDQPRPKALPSVARIDLVGEQITEGIRLRPVKKGKWLWLDDRRILFEPETDWPAGQEYRVSFDEKIFSKETILSDTSASFTTPDLKISFKNIEFYQDPKEISIRRVSATLSFSHPVDKSSLEEKLSMSMRASGAMIDDKSTPYAFDISYDKNLREVYILSDPIVLPKEPNFLKIHLKNGVKTILGGASAKKEQENKILIPDVYSFLKVATAKTQIVRNAKNEPEQILMLEFTDEIDESELLDKLSLYLLPSRGETAGKNYWEAPGEVTKRIVNNSTKVELRMIPNERKISKVYNFVFDLPERRYLYMKIAPGLTSANKFIHAAFFDTIVPTPEYPKEVDISGDGSILTYSGEHKLSTLSRGLPALKYKIGRLLEGQLYHLITQSDGNMKSPNFHSGYFKPSNISEYVEEIVDIYADHPRKASYSSLDLTRYLPQEKGRFGLFFVDVKGWNRSKNREIYGANDRRLILVTDLGLIVKNNSNSSHELFVQSIQSGEPVMGASVELLGRNGIALYKRQTGSEGHVSFPITKDFKDEEAPTVYVVKSGSDISFIPFAGRSRQINLSKFDIGGVNASYYRKNPLNAFAFSDRGIYRPGETVNLGFIVKNVDLSNVAGIPVEVVVRGPRNNEVKVQKTKVPEKGLFDMHYATDPTSDTGRYRVTIHLLRNDRYRGREIGSVNFSVEEFQPDTMKITSRLDEVHDLGWSVKQNISAKTELKNLFGIPAQNRKMAGRVVIRPVKFRFKQYQGYTFTDPFLEKNLKALSVDENLKPQITDADGLATFDIDLQRFKEGTYDLLFTAEGFDQAGGRSVIASNSTRISPLSFLVGHRADGKLGYINANSKRSIEFIAIEPSLKKVAKDELTFKLIEIQHISTLVKQNNGTYKYQSVKKEKQIKSKSVTILEEGFVHNIDTASPGDFAIEIHDQDERKVSRVEFSVVGHGNLAGKLDKKAELQLKLNKADYRIGELIEMNIKAPYSGAGLISIETDRVHEFKWFKTDSQSTLQTIRVPEGLEGTAYVNVSFVRDIGSKEIFTSPLSYAVKPFSIDKSNRITDVILKVDTIVRPGKAMEIGYSASKDSKMVVFAVDEGILQVAKYTTPAPLEHFLKKRALDVETAQILDLILPEFNLIRELSASGGGSHARKALAKNLNPFARKTDIPAVFWSGILDGSPTMQMIRFDVPDTFAGSLRVFAVAVSEEAMGVATDTTIVRGPFVISPNVLTQAAPGDEFLVTVGVANIIDGSGKGAQVDLDIRTSEHLQLLDSALTQLTIDEGSEEKYSFRVKAQKMLGAAMITITAQHKNDIGRRSVSLSVRPAMPYFTSMKTGFAESGRMDLVPERSLFANLATQSVAASASPLVLVDGLSAYLKNYPHGCTEQVVSKVFPLVGLMSHPAYGPYVENVQSHFSHVINKLRERQLSDGGFAFWPGVTRSAEYPTIYVTHFLIEARELGYPVPNDMLDRAKRYLTNYVAGSATTLDEARDRANGIYLLTRLRVVTTNYLVDLQEYLDKKHKKEWRADLAASYMAATYKLLQKDREADKLISGFKLDAVAESHYDDFHSKLTQNAQHIFLLAKHFPQKATALSGEQLLGLTKPLFKGEYNTIASAYTILALGAYSTLALDNDFAENIIFSALYAGGKKEKLQAKAQPFLKTAYPVDTQKVTLAADKPLYYLNSQAGFDSEFPETAVNEGIEIIREYLDDNGQKVTTFEQGKELNVRLRVRALNDKYLTNIAIIDLLPGGFEVIRSSVSRTAFNWRADYVDIREDRVVYYGSFDSTVRDLIYRVKLSSAGDFVIPPSYAESMYDRSIRSMSKAATFKVNTSQ